ncbi:MULTISPECIES: alpha/beta fold hydrolase [unclassified Isoptericola]|uniref:alpha/beta fold hydrolase n=1 Tax=unclassified Isoptericola TaxID=2623355 RepID=UPI00365CA11F
MNGDLPRLHVREWGGGDRTALLLHGFMGSGDSWWRVGPALAESGWRVLAPDLPGHGSSPRDPQLTVPRAARAVVATFRERSTAGPEIAVGHSYGGVVLAAARAELRPARTVLVDALPRFRGGGDPVELRADYERDRRARTYDDLRRTRPHYGEQDARVEAAAAEAFDPVTAAAVVSSPDGDWPLPAGAAVIRPAPSAFVPDDDAARLAAGGVVVRDVPGAAHSVWYGHYEEFMAALREVLPR